MYFHIEILFVFQNFSNYLKEFSEVGRIFRIYKNWNIIADMATKK